MYNLSKDFRFESAHRLADGYEGKCKNIHGHSWNGRITIQCEKLDKFGFAIDYSDIKKIIKPIEDKYDHSLLLNINDREIIELCEKNNFSYTAFDGNPTSEFIAKIIYDLVKLKLKDKFPDTKLMSIEIMETCTSSCIYTGK